MVADGITQAQVFKPSVGTYCFRDLPGSWRSAVAVSMLRTNGAGVDTVVSVYMQGTGEFNGAFGCSGAFYRAAVITYDISNAAPSDRAFTIWFEE